MLSNLLTELQKLLSPRFIVSVFFPMLAFFASNIAMLYFLNEPFREFVITRFEANGVAEFAFLMATTLIAVAIAAYMFSALLPPTQSLMEGRWFRPVASLFTPGQARRFEHIRRELISVNRLRGHLFKETPSGIPQWEEWKSRLQRAREQGAGEPSNNFGQYSDGYKQVSKLEHIWRKNGWISMEDLEKAVATLEIDLRRCNADLNEPHERYLLDITQMKLFDIIDDVVQFSIMEGTRLHNKTQFSFGDKTFSPTAMGNIANTVQSYGEGHYNLNVEVFWPRMQRALQKDKEFGPIIQDSKMQLDFLLACSALTAIWATVWTVILMVVKGGAIPFYVASIGGVVVSYGWYRVATAHYRTFAAVMRTSIDLLRFDLLKDLHLASPGDMDGERELWDLLHRISALNEPVNLQFQHTKPTQIS